MPGRWTGMIVGALLAAATFVTPASADVAPQIIGGTPAAQGEFPWMVRLSMDCGGVLIRPNIVLTAAHCVGPTGQDTSITATLNNVDLQNPTALQSPSNYVYRPSTYSSPFQGDDWALVRLQSSFSMPLVRIATSTTYNSGTFTIAGWGATYEGGPQQRHLMKTQVPLVSDGICNSQYDGDIIANEMICAGYSFGGIDACQGDSGGPLFRRDASNQWVVVGLTSWGYRCAQPDYSGVYTQVSTFAQAIQTMANTMYWNPCGEAGCSSLTGAYISHYTGAGCTGTESYYTPYAGAGVRRSWDGGGVPGVVLRTVTNRSYRGTDGVCHNSWPNGNTLSGFVTIYRHPCFGFCVPLGGAYISHYTAPDCAGSEYYYTGYFGNDGIRRSWDGSGMAGTSLASLTTYSWRGTDMTCHNDWPFGNPLTGLAPIYR